MEKTILKLTAAALSALLILSGCSGSSSAPAASASTAANETAAVLDGSLAGYSGEILTLLSGGKNYSFHITDHSVFVTTDVLNIGDSVEVSYTGALNGTDGTGTTVTKVEDKTPKSQQIQTIAGTVTDLTATTITIQTASALLKFDTSIAKMVTKDTIQVGDTAYIEYYGTISGTDTSACAVQMVIDNNDNKQPVATALPEATPVATAAPAPTLTPVDDIPVKADNEWLYALCDSNIYMGNSTDYQKVSYLYQNQAISAIGRTDDGWTEVNQEGTIGFVPSSCLTSNPPATPTPTPTPTAAPTPTPTAAPTPPPTVAPTPTPVPVHTLYIYYLNQDETQLFPPYIGIFAEGGTYSIDSPRNLGTTPSDATISGTMGTEDVVETVYYTQLYGPATPNPTDSGNGGEVG